MRRVGLQAILLVTVVGLLAVLSIGSLAVVRRTLSEQLHRDAVARLESGSRAVAVFWERYQALLVERGDLLAQLPSLQDAVLERPEVLSALLKELLRTGAGDLLQVLDPQGRLLATQGPSAWSTAVVSPQAVEVARARGRVAEFLVRERTGMLVSAFPLTHRHDQRLLGVLALGVLVDPPLLLRLVELSGGQVAVAVGDQLLTAPGWSPELVAWATAHGPSVEASSPLEMAVKGQRYLVRTFLLPLQAPPGTASPARVLVVDRLDESLMQRTERAIVWIGAFGLLLGVVASVALVRSVVRPVLALVADTRRIGHGELTHRATVRGSREVSALATSVNEMVERLDRAYRELRQWNETLEQKVQERSQALEQLQQRLVQTEKLAAVGQLGAGVAHEINNPLASMLGNIQLAQRYYCVEKPLSLAETKEVREILGEAEQAVTRCRNIVRQLLNFSRQPLPQREAVNLHEVLEETLGFVGHQVSLQQVTVQREFAADLPIIHGDRTQLQQVFVNLVLNAVQAMPSGGRLRLGTSVSPEVVTVEVTDSGGGIKPEDLPKIFDPFFTTKPPGSGTGLGLTVSYGIVERHAGRINVQSDYGRGATFRVSLPRHVVASNGSPSSGPTLAGTYHREEHPTAA